MSKKTKMNNLDREDIITTIYNILYEQDTTNKKSCLSLSEEMYEFIEELLKLNKNEQTR